MGGPTLKVGGAKKIARALMHGKQGRIQGGLWGLQPPQMILRSPAHLGLKYESCPVFLTGPWKDSSN